MAKKKKQAAASEDAYFEGYDKLRHRNVRKSVQRIWEILKKKSKASRNVYFSCAKISVLVPAKADKKSRRFNSYKMGFQVNAPISWNSK